MISYSNIRFFNLIFLFIFIHSLSTCCQSTVIFNNSNYEFSVSENEIPGEIGLIFATSSDGAQLLYSITNGNIGERFMIDTNSGNLFTNIPLNYEIFKQHNLTVQASTGNISNTTNVTIFVINIDDISPICESYSYHIYVSDDTPHDPPQFILNLSCSDIDSMSLSYSILAGNDDSNFELVENTLNLVSALNYTLQTNYSLTIRVSDNATTALSLEVRIVVLPDVELPPVFTQDGVYSLFLFENSTLEDILQVSLTTSYISSLDVIQYSLLSGDLYSQFSINSSTGVLSLRSSLDRETIANYTLSIMAFDQSVYPIAIRTVLATVLITVLDINDNDPMFDPDDLVITISIDTPLNSQFSTLLCSDPDSGENSIIASYSLTNEYIRINSSSGDLFTTGTPFPLDSGPQLTHQVNVECVDLGTPARTGFALLEISVRHSNIHSPQFSESSLTFEFEENVYVLGRNIFQVCYK
ncbi:hypothetical protein LOD99_3374 [Oopsacas minuta]|uniref:Cadherin domain-containing protein n=1 Tax=Oopsacas minuta TaxID=111878 RepID=A0AAV7JWT4_9METZ|nr:hypothetical protein LOD99_3374 [Oopsacas minuta]